MKMRPLFQRFCAILLIFIISKSVAGEPSQLVLVASEEATISQFTPAQLRKLFLGLTSGHNVSAIRPLRNMSDKRLYNVFLQKVVFMSARNYERHLLSRVITMGGQRPPSFSSQIALIQELRANPSGVSYMWQETARITPGITVIQKLW